MNQELDLRLRRDRDYVYFPDAVWNCLNLFDLNFGHGKVVAECFKTSDRILVARETPSALSGRRPPELFGRITCSSAVGERTFSIFEIDAPNEDRYDLVEPEFDHTIENNILSSRAHPGFPSAFHRWAVLCKRLYNHGYNESKRRMLIMRIALLQGSAIDAPPTETVKLDLLTKDRFMKFSIHSQGFPRGEVVATDVDWGAGS